eukprot:1387857-Amphidinium_carterae.1
MCWASAAAPNGTSVCTSLASAPALPHLVRTLSPCDLHVYVRCRCTAVSGTKVDSTSLQVRVTSWAVGADPWDVTSPGVSETIFCFSSSHHVQEHSCAGRRYPETLCSGKRQH